MPEERAEKPIGEPSSHSPLRTWHPGLVAGVSVIATLAVVAVAVSAMHWRVAPRVATYATMRNDLGAPQGGPAYDRPARGMGMMRGVRGGNGQGATVGAVTAINGASLSVRSEGTDLTVTVASSTSFYKQGVVAKQSDLQVGDIVVVSGTPDSSGNIAATAVEIR